MSASRYLGAKGLVARYMAAVATQDDEQNDPITEPAAISAELAAVAAEKKKKKPDWRKWCKSDLQGRTKGARRE